MSAEQLYDIADKIDEVLRAEFGHTVPFVLLTQCRNGGADYLTNIRRDDAVPMIKDLVAQLEEKSDQPIADCKEF